ncbi:uncharacterized protein LOC130742449 [Lotus japonicus]|uniref:uncharacterized protein LOC130742449 n=1 Tax=Lotus japonicus TaxID=34305 RepID=UPI002584754C|nr:uncharacterized protein LOC130742449 [Lotus japonicus]
MFNAKPELPQKSVLQIKKDDKFFCRLLSKESSMSNPSFRVAAVAVPFVWESQPGTPKYTFSEHTLPPLTPPPSYHLKNVNATKKTEKKSSRSKYFLALIPKFNLKKMIMSSSSSSSLPSPHPSWSSSPDSSSKVVPDAKFGRRRFLSSSFDFRGENEKVGSGSPTSTLCFGIPRSFSSNSGFQSNYRRQA